MITMASPRRALALAGIALVAVAGCTGSASPTSAPSAAVASVAGVTAAPTVASSPVATPSPTDTPSAVPSPSITPKVTAVPTSIDPCQLISAQEAGGLTGETYGPGLDKTTSSNSRICTYGANTKSVFQVIVAVAPDAATAQKEEAAAQADLQANASRISQGLDITEMPGFAQGADAVLMSMKPNVLGIDGRAIYVLRGTIFFGFSDLVRGGAAPSADAVKAEAMTVLGRLP